MSIWQRGKTVSLVEPPTALPGWSLMLRVPNAIDIQSHSSSYDRERTREAYCQALLWFGRAMKSIICTWADALLGSQMCCTSCAPPEVERITSVRWGYEWGSGALIRHLRSEIVIFSTLDCLCSNEIAGEVLMPSVRPANESSDRVHWVS